MSVRRAVLLVGSARPSGESTSESLGRRLLRRLEAGGAEWSLHHAARVAKDPVPLLDALDAADLFILSTPLYVDSLPYLATLALETVAASRPARGPRARFVAIVNCGFPEASQTRTALAIARVFARRARFEWAGGLGLGGGELIAGRPLESVGWMARHVEGALDLAGAALLAGDPVPDAAIEEMARPMVPAFLYTLVGDARWRRAARHHGARDELDARPYVGEAPVGTGARVGTRAAPAGSSPGRWPEAAPPL